MTSKFKIGIDYGGTKIEGILMDLQGKEVLRKRSTYDKNYKSGIETVKSLVEEFDNYTKSKSTVGVGIPGSSSNENGLIKNANAIWLNDKPFKSDLENVLERNVRLMNDANCFALSEAIDGSGANFKSVWGIIIGSGFGGSFVFNKQVVEGVNQVAGDWGHQPLPYPTKEEYEDSATDSEPIIIAETDKQFPIFSAKEAAEELEKSGLSFILFKNEEKKGVNILFRREDGNIGWVQSN